MPETSKPRSLDALRQRWVSDPTPQLSLHLADELGRHNRPAEAVEVLEQTLSSHPEHVAAQVALGRFRQALGQHRAASKVLEKVVTADPTHLVANKLLVKVYLDLGKEKQARDRLDLYALLNEGDPDIEQLERNFPPYVVFRLPSLPPPPPDLATLAPVFSAARGAAEAEPSAAAPPAPPSRASVIPGGEPFPELWEGIGDGEYWRRFAAEGIFPLPPAEVEPEAATRAEKATVTLGDLYLRQDHLAEAEKTFREVLEREPENRAALEGLDTIERRRASPATADADLESKERKARALKEYLHRLRAGAQQRDH